jgi:hypothetical protein
MIASTWNSLFLTVAMAAGMFAQQVAHKLSAASEDRQVNSLAGLEEFSSAQSYYVAGRFHALASVSEAVESVPPAPGMDDGPAVGATELVTPLADSMVAVAPGAADEREPQLEGPSMPPTDPATQASELAGTPESAVCADPPMASDESFAAGVQDAALADETAAPATIAQPVSEASAAGTPQVASSENAGENANQPGAAEVLPPPTPEKEPRPSVAQFGAFDEQPSSSPPPTATPRAPLPPSIALPGERRYPEVASSDDGRYATTADLIRERAVARGEQRRQRVETRKWLGTSPLRPSVSASPYTAVEEPQQLLLVVPHVSARVQP